MFAYCYFAIRWLEVAAGLERGADPPILRGICLPVTAYLSCGLLGNLNATGDVHISLVSLFALPLCNVEYVQFVCRKGHFKNVCHKILS